VRKIFYRIRVLFIFMALTGFVPSALSAELQAGAAVVDITPPIGFPMWGYAARHDAPSLGTLDPLKARAVVLAVGPEQVAPCASS
jgi:neutral ceramidase